MSIESQTDFITNVKSRAFQVPELVENILKYLDNDDLLTVRSVAQLWNLEAGKVLLHRKYKQSEQLNANDILRIQYIYNCLRTGPLINPSILIGTLSINLNRNHHPQFQKFLSDYGEDIRNITINGPNFTNSRISSTFIDILNKCPNIETLKLNFEYSHAQSFFNHTPGSGPFNNLKLNKLSTIEFKPIIKCSLNCNFSTRAVYVTLLNEIIKCSNNLENLVLKDVTVADYLEAMTTDLQVVHKLKKLQTLSICNAKSEEIFIQKGLSNLLTIVSPSLKTLYLLDVTWSEVDLSSYPIMPNLKTLLLKTNNYVDYSEFIAMDLSNKSLQQLNTLILGDIHYHFNKFGFVWPFRRAPEGLDFNWPFCSNIGEEKLSLINVEWNKDMKFLINRVNTRFSNGVKPALNVVVYVRWGWWDKRPWLNKIFQELSRINVASLFIDLMVQDPLKLKEYCISKCSSGKIPSLKLYVIRTFDKLIQEIIEVFHIPETLSS